MPEPGWTHNVLGMTDRTALITGASRGLGRALATELAHDGWRLIVNARGAEDLAVVAAELGATAVAGDLADSWHRAALIGAVEEAGGLDLLVNNASVLGPMRPLGEYPLDALERAFAVNVLAPLALIQGALPYLRASNGAILNITSDAAVEAYETWGGYGATKAALEQLSHVLAAEEPEVSVWWADPGEMRTQMLAEAMPDEDPLQFPLPTESATALLRLINPLTRGVSRTDPGIGAGNATTQRSGRYRVGDL